MKRALTFCCADESLMDDAGELLDATPMSGMVRVKTRRPQGLLASLRSEGRARDVIVACTVDGGEVVGVGVRSEKDCFVDGRPEPVRLGFLHGLRGKEQYRRGLALARGYRFFRDVHRQRDAHYYLTAILGDNRPAMEILTSGRAGLPVYDEWGGIETFFLDPRRVGRRLGAGAKPGVRIAGMRMEDAGAVVEFLRMHGRRRQFFPVYETHDFLTDEGLLPGLGTADILLAWEDRRLIGCVGVWDQSRFKFWEVAGYGFPLRPFRRAYNVWSRLRGRPTWPEPGAHVSLRSLAVFCVREDDARVTRSLLGAAARLAATRGAMVLSWSLHERDSLVRVVKELPHVLVKSRLFLVHWSEDGKPAFFPEQNLVPYLESGGL